MENEFKAAVYTGEISPEQANYLIADLNQQIYDKIGYETVLTFESVFNGYGTIINWCGIQIWSSDDDDRPWLQDETGDTEKSNLKQFIIGKMQIIKNNISKIILE